MAQSVHTFAGADVDSSAETRPGTAFIAATNIALEPGYVDVQRGNVLVPYVLPAGVNTRIGGSVDGSTGTMISLLYNSLGNHRIIRYDPAATGGAGAETTVLEWSGLNLDLVVAAAIGVDDGLFIWLDAEGYLRSINLLRASAGVYTDVLLAAEPYALHLVKVPPAVQHPIASRQTGTGSDPRESLRIIQSKAYQFACRWNYADGEQTILSPWSDWLDITIDPVTAVTTYIAVTLPPAPSGVSEVEVLVRQPDSDTWLIADTIRRTGEVIPTAYRFYGLVSGGAIDATDALTPFESEWPGKAAVIAKNQLFKANTVEGYPTPEPVFTAALVSGNATEITVQDVYNLHYQLADDTFLDEYYVLDSGVYGASDSTYSLVYPDGSGNYAIVSAGYGDYGQVFVDSRPNEKSPANRTITTLAAQQVRETLATTRTLHENTTYRVSVQFYDAQGKSAGASTAKTILVPAQNYSALQNRSLSLTLTTTGASNLNAEIPAWAYSYQFVIARNSKAIEFRQGLAADTLAYLGIERITETDGTVREVQTLKTRQTPHEKLRVDIGNWPAAGLGYVYTAGSGDVLRFLEDGVEFPITKQEGDYVEVQWKGYPAQGRTKIEIYTPNTTAANEYFERGPRMAITRTGSNRSYSQTTVALEGDCFLADLIFPVLAFDSDYLPPNKKVYHDDPVGQVTVESMVPAYRLAPSKTIITNTKVVSTRDSIFDGGLFGLITDTTETATADGTTTTVDTSVRTAVALKWLDMSYGGRLVLQIPLPLQQVARPTIVRYSRRKVKGTLTNGFNKWDALSQYDELPQEQGAVVKLTVADQTQTDGSVLLANQERGAESLSLGREQLSTASGQILLTISKNVIGISNALRGGFGCVDPKAVVAYAGKVFYPCREREEVLRYDRNGLTPLGEKYRFKKRLQSLFRAYQGATLVGFFNPRRQEYCLTFGPTDTLPGTTIVFYDRDGREAWADSLNFAPEAGLGVDNELVTWQAGSLWRHTPDAPYGTFFGEYTAPQITFEANQPDALLSKTWQFLGINSLTRWIPTLLTTPAGQQSRMLPGWLDYIEGVWRGAIRRDENSPGPATAIQKLHGGRKLQSATLRITLTGIRESPSPLVAATVSFLTNTGQQPNQ